MPAKFAYVDGTAVHYVHGGRTSLPNVVPDLSRGELLVFLHDAGGNAGLWQAVTALLGHDHSTVAFDFPAHGRSGGTESLASIAAYTSFFAAFLRTLGARPAVFVGHGMGAAIALQTALDAPKAVRALVLVGAAPRLDVPAETLEAWRNVMHGRAPQPFTTEAFAPGTDFGVMRAAWMEQTKTDPRVRYGDLVACAAHDCGANLAAITAPTLLVTGSDDHCAPPDSAERLQHAVRGARLTIIPQAGHLLPVEKPGELATAIHTFLSDLSGKSDVSDRSDA